MPRPRTLTDRLCAHAKAIEGQPQTDYFDADTTGLALRVFRSGARSWMYRFSWDDRRKWMTFGTYPATSLARARTLASEARTALEHGTDPRSALAKPETLRSICEEYMAREGATLRTGAARRANLVRLVYPELGERNVGDIRRSEIVRLLDRIEDERGPVAADKALEIMRRVFNWHATRSDDFLSPIVRGMSRTKPHERARKRTLSDDEIRVVWNVAATQGAFGRMVRFLLLTGARRTEASGMPWSELDLTTADWTLPAPRNKTKLQLLRPLPKAVLDVIGSKPPGAIFVFSNNGGHNQIRGYGWLKAEFDQAVTAQLGEAMPNWTLHDLRRTARSLLSRAGVPVDHAERVLGHVIGGVRGIYDRFEYRDEKADALAKLARLVGQIVSGRPTVVTLRRREAGANEG